jgi:hypothetical protein
MLKPKVSARLSESFNRFLVISAKCKTAGVNDHVSNAEEAEIEEFWVQKFSSTTNTDLPHHYRRMDCL